MTEQGKTKTVVVRILKWSAIGFGSLVGLTICAGVVAGMKDKKAADKPQWVAAVENACERYKGAPNEIKKSEIFRETMVALSNVTISRATGKLSHIRTNQGGSSLTLQIEYAGADLKNSILAGIDQGSPIYEAASKMTEDQCVVFSATHVESASIMEQSKVCDLDYDVTFTELGSCDNPASIVSAGPAVAAAPQGVTGGTFMANIEKKVADDSVAQYEIAKKGGDKMQVCVQAGMVAAAYLQAKDEPNYLTWKETEKRDCAAAGIPK